ncbi:hypothetical protein [Nonlabens ponticola]|uniref:tRNA (Guanine-N1)-methyltransferase n=1 Tax=Nonlabens ponticola TaxID=2496866 RepID=A0A3S9MX39_9FLAO|nr:hypothetical protein [Nonlabens ponticola]AZQ43714.1 hypothetical protein EJ995_05535 [Nonlabens ponticola]
MKKLFLSIIFLPALFYAQETTTDNPIDQQFEELIKSSNNYQNYKVVKFNELQQLRSNASQHIDELNQSINSLEQKLAGEQEAQSQLQSQLDTANSEIVALQDDKDSIAFLGLPLDKSTYSIMVWSIVGVLAAALVLLFLQFKKSHYVTSQSKKELATTEAELEELRRKSIEKEQKLGRQLQDERNKLSRLKKEQA